MSASEGSSQKAERRIIVFHSTANPNTSAKNNAAYEKRTWQNAYVHVIVDDKEAYQIGEPGYVAWGAANANPYAPLQLELCEFTDKNKALKAYRNAIEIIKYYCKKYGIPTTFDSSSAKGVKSHNWCSKHYGGSDHTDPIGYLKKLGVTPQKVNDDLAGKTTTVKTTASTAKVSKSSSKGDGYTWTAEKGTFKSSVAINVRSKANTNAKVVKVLPAGSSVKYDAWSRHGGYVWIRLSQSNSKNYYMVCRDGSGKAFGSFK